MSDLDDPLKRAPRTPEEEAAAELLRAAAERSETPVHPAVGERIWRGVEAGLASARVPRWRRPRVVLAAAASVATLTIAALLLVPSDEPPHLVAGAAFALDGGKTLRVNEPLRFESKVIAGAEGATFEAGAARLVVSKTSVIVFLSRDQHSLKDGSALYEITPGGIGFGLTMGPWEVRVTGTRFWVMQSRRENIIEVYEGSVRLKTGSREIDLRAGDSFREFLGDERRTALDDVRQEEPPPRDDDPPLDEKPPPKPPDPPPHPQKIEATPREPTLSEALARVRSGKYAEAEAMYRRIAEHTPAQAEVALYALAKMKLQKMGEIEQGLALLDELDRVHPRGALRQERMLTRIEVLFRHARCEQAKAAVAAYVKEYTHAIDSLREIDASQCAK